MYHTFLMFCSFPKKKIPRTHYESESRDLCFYTVNAELNPLFQVTVAL